MISIDILDELFSTLTAIGIWVLLAQQTVSKFECCLSVGPGLIWIMKFNDFWIKLRSASIDSEKALRSESVKEK